MYKNTLNCLNITSTKYFCQILKSLNFIEVLLGGLFLCLTLYITKNITTKEPFLIENNRCPEMAFEGNNKNHFLHRALRFLPY